MMLLFVLPFTIFKIIIDHKLFNFFSSGFIIVFSVVITLFIFFSIFFFSILLFCMTLNLWKCFIWLLKMISDIIFAILFFSSKKICLLSSRNVKAAKNNKRSTKNRLNNSKNHVFFLCVSNWYSNFRMLKLAYWIVFFCGTYLKFVLNYAKVLNGKEAVWRLKKGYELQLKKRDPKKTIRLGINFTISVTTSTSEVRCALCVF